MGAIAHRSLQMPRKTHGWAAWALLAVPIFGVGSLYYKSSHAVTKPSMSVFAAVENNDLKQISANARWGSNLNELDKNGHTALYQAIANENYSAASALLAQGANPN